MKKRFVFDLDGTLLHGHYEMLDDYFLNLYGEKARPFLDNMVGILGRYEKEYPRYDYDDLSRYLTFTTKLDMSPKVVRDWDYLIDDLKDDEEEHAREVLEYLKGKGKSIAVLTNWFGTTQKQRLRRANLFQYLDGFFGGDISTKPHREAYLIATIGFDPTECVFIGDHVDNDYIGPKAYCMDAVLYDKHDVHHNSLVKVKSLDEIKRMY